MNRALNHGFSLLELSIVLVIVSLVAATGIGLGSNAIKAADRLATQEKLATIKAALNQYAKQNSYMPCPADRTLTPSNANFGTEAIDPNGTGYTAGSTVTISGGGGTGATAVAISNGGGIESVVITNGGSGYSTNPTVSFGTGSGASALAWVRSGQVANVSVPRCNVASGVVRKTNFAYIGMVPVRALGLPDNFASDSWGNKITYAVVLSQAQNIGGINWDPNLVAVRYGDSTNFQNSSRAPTADVTGFTNSVIFVLVSHGPDGKGAYPTEGSAIVTPCGSTAADSQNCSDSFSFVDGRTFDGTQASQFFDDIVVWDNGLSLRSVLSNVSAAAVDTTSPIASCPTGVCEPWCASCNTNYPAAPTAMGTPQLCRKTITSTTPCQATCLWGGSINSSGKVQPCP